ESFEQGLLHRALSLIVEAAAVAQVNDGGERTSALRPEELAGNSLRVSIDHRDRDDIRESPAYQSFGQPRLAQPFHDALVLALPLLIAGVWQREVVLHGEARLQFMELRHGGLCFLFASQPAIGGGEVE